MVCLYEFLRGAGNHFYRRLFYSASTIYCCLFLTLLVSQRLPVNRLDTDAKPNGQSHQVLYGSLNDLILSLEQETESIKTFVRLKEQELINTAVTRSVNGVSKLNAELRTAVLQTLRDAIASRSVNRPLTFELLHADLKQNFGLINAALRDLRSVHERPRAAALRRSSEQVQDSIFAKQHFGGCRGRKLVCDLNKLCGFGCQVHHVLLCLNAALTLNRTLVLKSKPWNYSPDGWEQFFLPVSACSGEGLDVEDLPVFNDSTSHLTTDEPTLVFPFLPSPTPVWFPFAVPSDMPEKVTWFHSSPSLWWIGQLLKYLWQLQRKIGGSLNSDAVQMEFRNPVIGLHIRRTDKLIVEAHSHSIQSYLDHAEDYWNERDLIAASRSRRIPRRLYVASDDPKAIRQIVRKFGSKYTIYWNVNDTRRDSNLQERYSRISLLNLIRDIYFLSKSDFLVCTFSSLVCKMAYALKQADTDSVREYVSLDDEYWLPGSTSRYFQMVADQGDSILSGSVSILKRGDQLINVINQRNGIGIGIESRTGKKVSLPFYKTTEIFIRGNYTVL